MSKVIKIGVAKTSGEQIIDLDAVEIIAGKGIVNDRHFSENNDDRCQITLIESENIDFYNSKTKNDIPYINFRRNIITKGIKLNSLLEKKINIGSAVLTGIDLCRPCKHLQGMLDQNDIIKEFILKGGLRCKILQSGKISVGDSIKIKL
tara:strand:+ start:598 stop:1044 length:447 start_codon:yes stop_codon:yes gene_type:complete